MNVKKKIGIMHVMAAEENTPDAEYVKNWNRLVRKSIGLVKETDTEITFQIPRRGAGAEATQYKFMNALNDVETLFGCLELGKAGIYDAVVVLCFFDTMAREARQALDIPFLAPAEVSMRMASLMGRKFGVVTASDSASLIVEENIKKYGLGENSVPVRAMQMDLGPEEWVNCHTDAHSMINNFTNAARKLIEDGAEVIIPGCMAVDPVLTVAPGCEQDYPNGICEIDGVPILNVTALLIKTAETFIAMNNAGLPYVSRKLYYASARDDKRALEAGAELLEYRGPGFWQD
jgi:Asp/Glu/hydantoin racemase